MTTPKPLAECREEALARAAGFELESWMSNPPRPAMWHGTPEAMRKLVALAAGVKAVPPTDDMEALARIADENKHQPDDHPLGAVLKVGDVRRILRNAGVAEGGEIQWLRAALEWIATVNATDHEYQRKAREALAAGQTDNPLMFRRHIDLSRDEAELLDDLLRADGGDRARRVAEDLWRIWGMTPWEQRPPRSGA